MSVDEWIAQGRRLAAEGRELLAEPGWLILNERSWRNWWRMREWTRIGRRNGWLQ